MNNKNILFVISFIISFSLLLYSLAGPSKVFAQVPNPTVPCNEVRPNVLNPYVQNAPILGKNIEYQSLRPYQASPCESQTSDFATYCGNELTLKDTITVKYPGSENYLYSKPTNGPGGESVPSCTTKNEVVTCNYKVPVTKNITIDLSGADLPIMGNTGDSKEVVNSQNPIKTTQSAAETLTDADKMNSYVSWYLNGTLNRAEYPFLENSMVSGQKVVDYSGPLNKLLPQDIQFAKRSATIQEALDHKRHDQVVGCSLNLQTFSILGVVGEVFDWGKIRVLDVPIPCYTSGFISTIESGIKKEHRLSEWDKDGNLPPLMSDYPKYADYLKAYKIWRGNACANISIPRSILGVPIPIIGGQTILLCVDNIFKESKFNSYLFNYIPLSSTEDVEGQIRVDSVSSATNTTTNGVSVSGVKFSKQIPSTLFFPHLQESDQLGSLLQDTYAPKGADTVGSPTNVAAGTSCNTVQVRSNAGDDLFATSLKGELSYTAIFSCSYQEAIKNTASLTCAKNTDNLGSCVKGPWTCLKTAGESGCGTGYTCGIGCTQNVQGCVRDTYISMSTSSKIPAVDNIWSRLVAGPMAAFKRIFPKTNTVGSVGQIIDIAGSTNITYSGEGISQSDTALKFPHVGGISEYFLKGIQTALRPKGFGESITFAGNSAPSCTDGGTMPNLPLPSGSCNLTNTDGITVPPTLKHIIEAASQTFGVPPALILGVMYGEGDFNPGRYDWTDENVKKWSLSCASVPNCNPTTFPAQGVAPYFENDWDAVKDGVNVIDPTRVPNPCNLLDAIFALTKDLSKNQYGSRNFAGKTCYGIQLNSGTVTSNSCTWNSNDYETAIRVWEFGTAYNSTITCATKVESCLTGGGLNTACADGDTCEQVGGSGNSSHNACIWDVAHSQ